MQKIQVCLVAKIPNRIKYFVKGNKIFKIKSEKEFEKIM